MQHPLLIEIGTEELPPQQLNKLVNHFAQELCKEFEKQGIEYGTVNHYITPRRIAVLINDVPEKQATRKLHKRGPTLASAYDAEKQPTKALLGFIKSCSASIEDIRILETPDGAWVVYEYEEKGKALQDVLSTMIETALEKIPAQKRMRWGNNDFAFLRPIHWVTIVHGSKPIELKIYDLISSNITYGHRFHAPRAITLHHAQDYVESLKNAYVIASHDERKALILSKIEQLAQQHQAKAHIEPDLLEMVTGLVEWPQALAAEFSKDFLEVPQEALISSMQNHQKCFPLHDKNAKLKNTFILISNIVANDSHLIIEGNERVMHARLNDAKFFYDQDRKIPLYERLELLKKTVFQKKLGSLYDKSVRVAKLAHQLATLIGANPTLCERAGKICKADLLTEMIFEFPELQGIMGYYYALNDGEPEEIASAIKESYYPRFAKDILPSSLAGTVIALADRLDTLVGIFGIGQIPTGDKDPYALRRQALAILRIIIEKKLKLDLTVLLTMAKQGYGKLIDEDVVSKVETFCLERFKALYQEQNINPQVIEAVVSCCTNEPYDCSLRVMAVNHFQKLNEAQALSAANKRVRNILQKSGLHFNFNQLPSLNVKLLKEPSEQKLADAIEKLQNETLPLINNQEYQSALVLMSSLQPFVDSFFNDILVMAEDESIRKNRLILLAQLYALFSQIADISKLAL